MTEFCYRCGHCSADHFHALPHPCIKVSKTKQQTINFVFAEVAFFQEELCPCDAFVAKSEQVLVNG